MNDADRAVLTVAAAWYRRPGSRDTAAAALGLTPTRYAQRLNALLSDREALEAEPLLIGRLRRVRDAKARRLGWTD